MSSKMKERMRKRKAAAVLPLLRQAVRLNVQRWDVERRIEEIIGKEVDDFYSHYDALCVPIDEPTAQAVKEAVTLADAQQLVDECTHETKKKAQQARQIA
jgi:hypothetical protein